MTTRRHTARQGWLAAMLLRLFFVPFVAAQLMAPGFMPAATPDGLRVVLCTGTGETTVYLTPSGDIEPAGDPADRESQAMASVCPWAAAASAGLVPEMTSTARALKVVLPATAPVPPQRVAGTAPNARPHARAPPLI